MLFDLAEEFARARAHLAPPFSPAVEHPGGCYAYWFFGERRARFGNASLEAKVAISLKVY